jgi:hypothetical protein
MFSEQIKTFTPDPKCVHSRAYDYRQCNHAFECIHALQSGSKNAGKFCAYKLDLMKAYDRVDWNYLEAAMRKIGFADQWVKWIMVCVCTM